MLRHRTQPQKNKAALYVVVFGSLTVKVAACLLITFVCLQPVAQVYAAEDSEAQPVAVAALALEPEPEAEPEVTKEATVNEESVDPEVTVVTNEATEESDIDPDPVVESVQEAVSAEIIDQIESEQVGTASPTDSSTKASSTEELETDSGEPKSTTSSETNGNSSSAGADSASSSDQVLATSTKPVTVVATSTASSSESASTTPDLPSVPTAPDNSAENPTPATPLPDSVPDTPPLTADNNEETTEETTEVPLPTMIVINESISDANRYQFSASECVSVGDGSFYCNKPTSQTERLEDEVFAELDNDGDREIYLRKNGNVTKLTDNNYDDASPYYDSESEEVLWHRMIGGRYQIIRYDLSTGSEEQLTSVRQNHMEPTQSGKVAAWQTWSNDNWEIAIFENGEEKIITTNQYDDVAPVIRDGYIMWHTTNKDGEKLLSVYEIATEISSTVADPDGGHVENPRFVLVYDTKFENGDVVTKEYDPKTGEIRPIGSKPAPVPTDVPSPEPTGETTALVNTKTSSRDDSLNSLDEDTNSNLNGSSTPNLPSSSTASSSEAAATSTEAVEVTPELSPTLDLSASTTEVLPLTEFDLIIEPYVGASPQAATSSVDHDTNHATSS